MSARKASSTKAISARDVTAALRALADPERARSSAWFFKTGPGEYGEGDTFIGVRVPAQRRIARTFRELSLSAIETLLNSPVHEDRFTALEILVMRYERGDAEGQEQTYRFYLAHTDRVNNWDLVDTSAPYIVGEHLRARSRKPVYALARSKQLWERRIAMVSCAAWIKSGDLDDAFAIARLLLDDPNDIIHKAVGWMLREAGTHSRERLLAFLEREYPRIARTTLRSAIELFTPAQRKKILGGEF